MKAIFTLKDMKAAIRTLLNANPQLETESEKRRILKTGCPFSPSDLRHSDWNRAVASVLKEKPSEKLVRPLDEIPEHLREWATRNNLIK